MFPHHPPRNILRILAREFIKDAYKQIKTYIQNKLIKKLEPKKNS